jgi:hypothetical protein
MLLKPALVIIVTRNARRYNMPALQNNYLPLGLSGINDG